MIPYRTLRLWDHYLLAVQRGGGTDPIIGGGCIRDLILGIPVNDVDIFHEDPVSSFPGAVSFAVRPAPEGYDGRAMQLADAAAPNGDNINLIEMEDVNTILSSFGADINQVYYTRGDLIITQAFVRAFEAKKITFHMEARPQYIAKIKNKFGPLGYTFASQHDDSLLDLYNTF